MKDLKNLKGAKQLSKMEQKSIKGGVFSCWSPEGPLNPKPCPEGWYCVYPTCVYGIII